MSARNNPPRKVWLRASASWDLALAMLGTAAFAVALYTSDRPLEEARTVGIMAIPFGVAIAGAAFVSVRWLDDRTKDSEYGELVRVGDPEQLASQIPYYLIVFAGIAASLVGVLLTVTFKEFGRSATAALYSVMMFLGLYSVLGLLSLAVMTFRHSRRMSRLRALQEEDDRRKRASRTQD